MRGRKENRLLCSQASLGRYRKLLLALGKSKKISDLGLKLTVKRKHKQKIGWSQGKMTQVAWLSLLSSLSQLSLFGKELTTSSNCMPSQVGHPLFSKYPEVLLHCRKRYKNDDNLWLNVGQVPGCDESNGFQVTRSLIPRE